MKTIKENIYNETSEIKEKKQSSKTNCSNKIFEFLQTLEVASATISLPRNNSTIFIAAFRLLSHILYDLTNQV